MNIRRIIPILIGVVLISFGIGFYSLRYYDNITFEGLRHNDININRKDFLNIRSKDSDVKIGKDGIKVKDGDDYVSISWDGIYVKGKDEQVSIGWDGITVKEGDKETRGVIDFDSLFGISTRNLTRYNIDEEKIESIAEIDSIKISSSFIDIKVVQGNTEDIKIKYHGTMKSNVLPKLETSKSSGELEIKLNTNSNNQVVTDSNVILKIIIPQNFEKDIRISSSSANIFIDDVIGTNLNIESSSGNVDLVNINEEEINISTASGNIDISNSSSNNMEVVSSSGNINIIFDDSASFKVTGKTSSGDVKSDKFMTIKKDKNNKFELIIGSGKNNMNISTSSGNIYFK